MAVERKFISEALKKVKIDRFVRGELAGVGCGEVDVKRTPLGTRITVNAIKPGLVIGRKGKNIQMLTEAIKEKFNIENPQLEVNEVLVPQLDPQIMAVELAATLERGIHFRRASYRMLQKIMRAGALGAQIEISGKISGERSRHEKFKDGFIKHCGETAKLYVKEGYIQANLKQGVLGVKIKITPPVEKPFGELQVSERKEEVKEEIKEETKEETKAEEKPAKREPKKSVKKFKKAEKKKSKKEVSQRATEPKKAEKNELLVASEPAKKAKQVLRKVKKDGSAKKK